METENKIDEIIAYGVDETMYRLTGITSSWLTTIAEVPNYYGGKGNSLLGFSDNNCSMTFTVNCSNVEVITQGQTKKDDDKVFSERNVQFREKLDF